MNLGVAVSAFSEAERKDKYYYLKLCDLVRKKMKLIVFPSLKLCSWNKKLSPKVPKTVLIITSFVRVPN